MTASSGAPTTSGGPSEAARACRSGAAILEATLEALAEHGIEGLTIDGVAARARVGKATIYRHWRSRAELVIDAMASLSDPTPVDLTGEVRHDLVEVFRVLGRMLDDPRRSKLLSALVDAAERDPELAALHAAHSSARRAPAREVLLTAVRRGDLPADTDVELAIDLIAGPLFYRRLIVRRPVAEADVVSVVDAVLVALRAPS